MAKVLDASERPCPILPVGWQLLISWMITALSALHLGTNNIAMAHLMLTLMSSHSRAISLSLSANVSGIVLHFLSVAFALRPS